MHPVRLHLAAGTGETAERDLLSKSYGVTTRYARARNDILIAFADYETIRPDNYKTNSHLAQGLAQINFTLQYALHAFDNASHIVLKHIAMRARIKGPPHI